MQLMASVNARRCDALPLYGRDFQDVVKIFKPNEKDVWSGGYVRCLNILYNMHMEEQADCLKDMLCNPERRIEQLKDACDRFILFVPAVKAPEPEMRIWHPSPSKYWGQQEQKQLIRTLFSKMATPLHPIASAMVTQFPDPRLIQYDCGKLQTLDRLLRSLKVETHRVLIFTQMTKMLDVLEAFLNYHGHIYLRLDGTTKVDQRQVLMERFNNDKRIFAFILSTRSGGVGVNLTGADTVIFYDSDWNPTMDAQAQDRCHRIGQTRDVHIYRLVSERTIEENILKKANQKRLLGDLAIEGGNFTTAYFKSSTIQDLFNVDQSEETTASSRLADLVDSKKDEHDKIPVVATTPPAMDEKIAVGALENALAACEDDQDVQAARTAKAEAVADLAEFDEDIPLEEQQLEPTQPQQKEVSKAEQEINSVIEKLSPIEKYAMKFIEATESAWSAEQLAAAEREIEEQKREWEKNRLAAMREEEERRARELEEEADIITYSREDAANQVSNIKKFRRFKVKARQEIKVKNINKKLVKNVHMKRRRKRRRLKHPEVEDRSPQLNGDTENSLDSTESLSSNSVSGNLIANDTDHNSPRTRSRGTVAINLWTLDVSPLLPGEKPMKRNNKESASSLSEDCQSGCEENPVMKPSKRGASSVSGDDSQSGEEEKVVVVKKKRGRPRNAVKGKHLDSGLCEVKKCSIILNDILADGQVHISGDTDSKRKSAAKTDFDTEGSEQCAGTENKTECYDKTSLDNSENVNSDFDANRDDCIKKTTENSVDIKQQNHIEHENTEVESKEVEENAFYTKLSPPNKNENTINLVEHEENENMQTESSDHIEKTADNSAGASDQI
ncbi:unnamed protein product [Acanthoscelides obtectus]|uniref:Helicase C-terminal domain-containing protein n=1 Tax=Acanthoscelides obtectus TaxID=200917 RepID=A0A9P0MF78_ACAOB|nr:unnamed protein product [Acanthoscelides obtectus]CAK1624605.1 Helicase domino [Acanthoscelides obtectus]